MLQLQIVSAELLAGLKFLMTFPQLANYRLVGGTALALQFGHRKSIDIDLFGSDEMDWQALEQSLSNYETPQFINLIIYNIKNKAKNKE